MARQSKAAAATAVYLRVSSSGQKDDSQAYEVERYVKGHGIKAVQYYRDQMSGKSLDRPAMKRLQDDVFGGQVSTIICWRLDRLARNLRDGVNLLADWCSKGVRVVSVCERLDLSGAVGQIIASVLFGVAQMEREAINERIRAGVQARLSKGLPMGRAKRDTGHQWNPAKRKIDVQLARSLKAQGVPVKDIAARFGCSRVAVYGALKDTV